MNLSGSKRGSTLLLVLAMLSILFLIGAALSYTTRLEGQASANYGELTQARMAAATGLPTAAPLMAAASQSVTTTLQPWYTAPAAWSSAARANGNANGTAKTNVREQVSTLRALGVNVQKHGSSFHLAPQAMFSIGDLSARVNLNAVQSEEALARYLESILPNGGAYASQRAKVLFARQGGDSVSTAPQRLDLRRSSAEPRIENLAELKVRAQGRNSAPLFSDAELRTLSSYLTVFSQSPELLNLTTTSSLPKLPLDSFTAESALETLKAAFPDKDSLLLAQFAANMADFADPDSIPTRMNAADGAANSPDLILGVEQAPLITEVYPDAATLVTAGDEGQFVEISNPWQKALILAGWQLKVAGGAATTLNVVLPAGGRLIITDNYDQPAEKSPPETGSFLSIFGARKDDALRKVIVNGAFELPDRDSFVTLEDAAGNLVDVFNYGNTGTMDSRISFQREDPRLRLATAAQATPFLETAGGEYQAKMSIAAEAWKSGNMGSISPTDLFSVSSAYVAAGAGSGPRAGNQGTQAFPWQMPLLTVSGGKDGPNEQHGPTTNLDLRLIDAFTNVPATSTTKELTPQQVVAQERRIPRRPQFRSAQGRAAGNPTGLSTNQPGTSQPSSSSRSVAANADDNTATGTRYAYGKINLNTCTKSALLAIDLDLDSKPWPDQQLIEKFESYRLRKIADKEVPFLNVSDFVAEFFPDLTHDELPLVESLLSQVTVNSSAFEVVAENRLSPEELAETSRKLSKRRPAVARARWIVALDEKPYSLLNFATVP